MTWNDGHTGGKGNQRDVLGPISLLLKGGLSDRRRTGALGIPTAILPSILPHSGSVTSSSAAVGWIASVLVRSKYKLNYQVFGTGQEYREKPLIMSNKVPARDHLRMFGYPWVRELTHQSDAWLRPCGERQQSLG